VLYLGASESGSSLLQVPDNCKAGAVLGGQTGSNPTLKETRLVKTSFKD
jgi:hypothetical protein